MDRVQIPFEERLLGPKSVAEMLDCSADYVRKELFAKLKIPYVRQGRRLFATVADVRKYRDSLTVIRA